VVLAGAAGVGLVAFWRDSLIPYLVIVALDAVSHAMSRPGEWAGVRLLGQAVPVTDPYVWRSLDGRLAMAGLEAAAALIAAALTAHWLGRDLRRPADEPRSWPAAVYRIATAAATWASGAWLTLVAIRRLDPSLAAGFEELLYPTWTLLIASAFAALAAGLTARGLGGVREAGPALPSTRVHRAVVVAARLVAGAGLILLIAAATAQIQGGDTLPWYSPRPFSRIAEDVSVALTVATPTAIYLDLDRTPDALFLLGGAAILAGLTLRFLLTDHRPETDAPIDRIGRDPRLIGRFLGAWVAMMGVIFALFPTFFLGGMAVLHFALRAYYG
jgi:hypothetical protein